VFNGNPQGIDNAINNNMFSLPGLAGNVLAIPAGTTGNTAGLCFEIFRPPSQPDGKFGESFGDCLGSQGV
jgi:hypothetical protein